KSGIYKSHSQFPFFSFCSNPIKKIYQQSTKLSWFPIPSLSFLLFWQLQLSDHQSQQSRTNALETSALSLLVLQVTGTHSREAAHIDNKAGWIAPQVIQSSFGPLKMNGTFIKPNLTLSFPIYSSIFLVSFIFLHTEIDSLLLATSESHLFVLQS
ncbi:hypothetical protein DFH28DRAFT_969025, partial [Melampsora americana]